MKTSLGIWAFSSMVTRFVPGGYQPEHAGESTVDRVRRAVDGLGDLIDGYEFHYPQELNEENADAIREALGNDHDVYCLAGGLHLDPRFGRVHEHRYVDVGGTRFTTDVSETEQARVADDAVHREHPHQRAHLQPVGGRSGDDDLPGGLAASDPLPAQHRLGHAGTSDEGDPLCAAAAALLVGRGGPELHFVAHELVEPASSWVHVEQVGAARALGLEAPRHHLPARDVADGRREGPRERGGVLGAGESRGAGEKQRRQPAPHVNRVAEPVLPCPPGRI